MNELTNIIEVSSSLIKNESENLEQLMSDRDIKNNSLLDETKKLISVDNDIGDLTVLTQAEISCKNTVQKLIKELDYFKDESKYDPNCEYCTNNVFVKDAIKTKEDLEKDKSNALIVFQKYNELKNKINGYGNIEVEYKKYTDIKINKTTGIVDISNNINIIDKT